MTEDQKSRKAEFDELFAKLPGRNNTERMRTLCLVAEVKPGTVRQWRMEQPYRLPSQQVIKLMRLAVGA